VADVQGERETPSRGRRLPRGAAFGGPNADKRRAVETLLSDAEWGQWSDREIAGRCAVADRTVNRIRAELSATLSQTEEAPSAPEKRTFTRGGKTHTMSTGGIGKGRSRPEAPPEPAGTGDEPTVQARHRHELQQIAEGLEELQGDVWRALAGSAAGHGAALEAIRGKVLALAESLGLSCRASA
jgi:hypothetical protein